MNVEYIHEDANLPHGFSCKILILDLLYPNHSSIGGGNDLRRIFRSSPMGIAKKPDDEQCDEKEKNCDPRYPCEKRSQGQDPWNDDERKPPL